MAKKNEVAVVEQQAGALALAADMEDFLLANEGAGTENIGADDVALPYLQVVQSLSPERDRTSPKYIRGAEEGHLFDTVTRELFDGEQGISVIICHYSKAFVEWVPRKLGGGFVKAHATLQEAEFNKKSPDNDIIETATYHVLYADPSSGQLRPAVLPMTSTKLPVSRSLNSRIKGLLVPVRGRQVNPPVWMQEYTLRTVPAKNKQGQPYYNIAFDYVGIVSTPDAVGQAKGFAELIESKGGPNQFGEGTGAGDGNPGF